jgi:hypothetical protein
MRKFSERIGVIVLETNEKKVPQSTKKQSLAERFENIKGRNIIEELPLTLYTTRGRQEAQ